jgi:hypothetical protein
MTDYSRPRQQTYADRQHQRGLRELRVWVPEQDLEKVKEFARQLREKHLKKQK